MHVLVSSNRNYLRITVTMLHSLYLSLGNETVKVWFLCHEMPQSEREQFCKDVKFFCGYDVVFVEINSQMFASLQGPLYIKHISIETYFRLIAQFVLPTQIDRILWLDCDLIIKGDIRKFYFQNLDNLALVASVNTQDSMINLATVKRLNLPTDYLYFNAGVILFNLFYLREHTSLEYILDYLAKHAHQLLLQDQDLLNMLYYERAKVLKDCKYNCIVNGVIKEKYKDVCDAVVIHYAGWQKPWKLRWQDEFSHYYWDIRRLEGLEWKERIVETFGKFLNKIHYNDFLRCVCAPYFWLRCRIKTVKK